MDLPRIIIFRRPRYDKQSFLNFLNTTPYSDGLCTTHHKSNRLLGLETISKCKQFERICKIQKNQSDTLFIFIFYVLKAESREWPYSAQCWEEKLSWIYWLLRLKNETEQEIKYLNGILAFSLTNWDNIQKSLSSATGNAAHSWADKLS